MIQIRENALDSDTVTIEVDGVLDYGAIPVLKDVCDRHIGERTQVLLNLEGVVHITGLPETMDMTMPVTLKFKTNGVPSIYRTGGLRNPNVPHCRYDPLPSDIAH